MPRLVCCAATALVLFSSACAKQPESVTPPAAADATPKRVESAVVMPAVSPAAATDPFADEYRDVMRQIMRWDGDGTKLDTAQQRIKDMIAKDREYAPAYVALARVEAVSAFRGEEFDPKPLDRASRFVQHALKLRPDDLDAHTTAAWIATYRGDFDIAEESARKADALQAGYPEVKLIRAAIAMAQEQPREMMRLANEVLAESQDPDHRLLAYSYLTDLYQAGLHLDEADAAYRERIKLNPDSAWIRGDYAAFLLDRDDVDGAIREAEHALRIWKYPVAVGALVRAYIAKADELWNGGKIKDSADYIQKVAGLAGDNAELSFALGRFYEGAAVRGRDASMRQKALASYRRALELNPQHMEAERAVTRLAR